MIHKTLYTFVIKINYTQYMINKTLLISILTLSVLLFTNCQPTKKQNSDQSIHQIQTLSDDGAWCWFSDPRAIYTSENEIITGWVKKDGSIEIAKLNISNNNKEFETIFPQLEVDDHDNPAFAVLSDGNLLTMYAWHATENGVISNTTNDGSNIHTFQENTIFKPKTEKLLEAFPRETYTYANPYVLKAENNKVFSLGRWIGFKPNLIISSDNAKTWNEKYVVISNEPFDANNRPYAKYYSDGNSKIHMIYTNGHPRNEPLNSVYYCYYENRAFWRADGTKISDLEKLPFNVEDGSLVYQASNTTGRAWIADIAVKDDKPYILYSRHPEETDHRYFYAWYNAKTKSWNDYEICKAGKWFPQTPEGETEREPHYMGNMTVNPNKPNEIYVSREVNNVFEIEKYTTPNEGGTWEITPVTQNSEHDNVRPYIPRYQMPNAKTVVLWMENKKYIHYTDFDSRIKYITED